MKFKAAVAVLRHLIFALVIACKDKSETETSSDISAVDSYGILGTAFNEPSLDSLVSSLGADTNLCLIKGGSITENTRVMFRGKVLPILRNDDVERASANSKILLIPFWAQIKPYNGDTVVVYLHETRFNNTPTYYLIKKNKWIVVARAFGKT